MALSGREIVAAVLLACTAIPGVPASAQTGPAESSQDDENATGIIIVTADGKSYRLTADSLRDAIKAYAKYRDRYAPEGVLYFKVDLNEGETLDGLEFFLSPRKKNSTAPDVPLQLDAEGRLVLPTDLVATADWDLRANRKDRSIKLKPQVFSTGSVLENRRFGDFRLECRVFVAFARIPAPLRLLVDAFDVCDNEDVQLVAKVERPLASAVLDNYDRSLVHEKTEFHYIVPMSDETVSNEARLRLTYR